MRLALLGCLFCLLAFSLISGKRWHYLLLEFPLFALFVARALEAPPGAPPPTRAALALPVVSVALLALLAWAARPLLAGRMAAAVDTRVLAAGGFGAAACAAALAACRPAAATVDVRRVAVASVLAACCVMLAFSHALRDVYDCVTVARQLARHQAAGHAVAVAGDHHGQWTFAGRLAKPPQTIARADVPDWLATHPQGRVVFVFGLGDGLPARTQAEFTHPYRGGWLALLAAADGPAAAIDCASGAHCATSMATTVRRGRLRASSSATRRPCATPAPNAKSGPARGPGWCCGWRRRRS